MKTITRADWGLQLQAFARTIAPLIAAAYFAGVLTREGLEALNDRLAAIARRLACGPASAAELPRSPRQLPPAAPIRIPAAELLAAGGLEAAEIEAILTPAPAPGRKRSKRSTRGKAAAC